MIDEKNCVGGVVAQVEGFFIFWIVQGIAGRELCALVGDVMRSRRRVATRLLRGSFDTQLFDG